MWRTIRLQVTSFHIPLLEARSVEKRYGGVMALGGVSLEIRRGEVHALIGENGAGKSTLVRLMTGAAAPDRGVIAIDGHPVSRADPGLMRALGVAAIYQQPALFPDLTVAENLAIGLEAGGSWRRRADPAPGRADRLAERPRDDEAVRSAARPSGGRRRDALHLAPPRGDRRARRPGVGAPRR
jgi:rhamnose transport system ATP-binding protein